MIEDKKKIYLRRRTPEIKRLFRPEYLILWDPRRLSRVAGCGLALLVHAQYGSGLADRPQDS